MPFVSKEGTCTLALEVGLEDLYSRSTEGLAFLPCLRLFEEDLTKLPAVLDWQ